ncbi:hypothetical protein F5Y19DRAFT_467158 [Xylariaceae sp. FL1651]|nr:hypothetical protein F5Y19DRAFT_467158 [Xylariaceae sp. FL1651]
MDDSPVVTNSVQSECEQTSLFPTQRLTKKENALMTTDRSQNSPSAYITSDSDYVSTTNHTTESIRSFIDYSKHSWKLWNVELAWLVFSMILLIIITVVLSCFNNKVVPMLPLCLTLNTILAFLVTLVKATFMIPVAECICQLKWAWFSQPQPLDDLQVFEDASRGSWGSVILLYRHWKSLAGMGAIVTVVALVTTPITQLMINYPTRNVPTIGPATAPIIEIFNFKSVNQYGFDQTPFQNAIVQGLSAPWSDDRIKPAHALCASSNCTFPEVTSLAVCSDVRDITESGYLKTSFIPNPDITNLSFPEAFAGLEFTNGLTAYNMSISEEYATNCSFVTQDPYSLFTCKFRPNQTIAFANETDKLASLLYSTGIIYAKPLKDSSNTTDDMRIDLEYRALEAILYLCINSYDISVIRGNTITSLKSSSQRVIAQEPPITVNTTCYIDQLLYTQWCDLGHNSSYQDINSSKVPDMIFLQGGSNSSSRKFGADIYLLEALASYMYPQFTVYISSNPGRSNTQQDYTAYNAGQALNMLAALTCALNDPVQQLANIRAIIDNVAVSLTNQMRLLSPQFVVNGTAWIPETFVEIRWGWFVFLIIEVTLAAILVLATIARTKALAIKPIKSSALAILIALSPESRPWLSEMREGEMLRKSARKVYAQFRDGELITVADES